MADSDQDISITITLNAGQWHANLAELEKRLGSGPVGSAGYYCTQHSGASAIKETD